MFKSPNLIIVVLMNLAMLAGAYAGKGKDDAVKLVDATAAEITKDAAGTIKKIVAGEHPYKDKDDASFYVFVYNTDVVIVAHPKKHLVGRSYKGKPDVRGKKFRDEIVNTALKSKTGWVDYSYQKPGAKGIHAKTTYCKLASGSDGKKYVVCCGVYK